MVPTPEKTSDLWWLFSRQTVSVTQKESVLNAALLMKNRNFRHLPIVTEKRKVLGIISAQDIVDSLNLLLQSSTTAAEVTESLEIPVERIMSTFPIVAEPGDGLTEVAKKLFHHNLGALPLVNEFGIIQGIITLRDLVGLMGISSAPLNVPISEIMNTDVITIRQDYRIMDAVKLMSERRVRRLPAVTEKGDLVGLLTNKDILRHVAQIVGTRSVSSGFERPISEFMTRDVITARSDEDIREAANRMLIFGVGGLFIHDNPSRLALVTERDLTRGLSAKRSVAFLISAMQYELEERDVLPSVTSRPR